MKDQSNDEQKIIEEIKKRIFQEEEKLRIKNEQESMLEALEAVTHLNKEQILAIEAQVRREYELQQEKQTRKRQLLLIGGVAFLLVLAVLAWRMYQKSLPPQIVPLLNETFDKETSIWNESQVYEYRKTLQNGEYSFEVGKEWCYWDNISLYIPENFTIELGSVWKEGTYATFGLMLLQDNSNYSLFQMNLNQKATYLESIDGNYSYFTEKTVRNILAGTNAKNVQKVVVSNRQFSYFINDELVETGSLNANFNYGMVALRVCGIQKVNFTYLTIRNDDTGRFLLKEDFDRPKSDWDFEESYTRMFSFVDGKYQLDTRDKGFCNFTTIPFSSFAQDNYVYEISIDCYWQSGESDSFGLMIAADNQHTLNFELQSTGKARVSKYVGGKNTLTTAFKETKQISSPQMAVKQKVILLNKGNNYEYYVNDKLVDKGTFDFFVQNIGLRACGQQIVRFDNLNIKKIEVKE